MNATQELKAKLDEMLVYIDLAQSTSDAAKKLNDNNR